MFSYYFIIISLGNGESFIWTNLNLIHPRMLCTKFVSNWLSGSGVKVLNLSMYFLLFRCYFPLERGVVHHLNKFECYSPKAALYQVCLKLVQWFWRRRKWENLRRTTDKLSSEKLTRVVGLGELKYVLNKIFR